VPSAKILREERIEPSGSSASERSHQQPRPTHFRQGRTVEIDAMAAKICAWRSSGKRVARRNLTPARAQNPT
jgi:hypothetical protein